MTEGTNSVTEGSLASAVVQRLGLPFSLMMRRSGRTLGMLAGGSQALTVAIWGEEKRDTPALVVTATPEAAEEFAEDLRFFLARDRDGGRSQRPVILLPPRHDELIAKGKLLNESDHRFADCLSEAIRPHPLPPLLVTSAKALAEGIPDPAVFQKAQLHLASGKSLPRDLQDRLKAHGWEQVHRVEEPGQFARRGGIWDLFPITTALDEPGGAGISPIRVDTFGDQIDTIRIFDPDSQRSIGDRREVTLVLGFDGERPSDPNRPSALDLMGPEGVLFWASADAAKARLAEQAHDRSRVAALHARIAALPEWRLEPRPARATRDNVGVRPVPEFSGNLESLASEIRDALIRVRELVVACKTAPDAHRLRTILADRGIAADAPISVRVGDLSAGFEWVTKRGSIGFLNHREVFRKAHIVRTREADAPKPERHISAPIDSYLDIEEGDFVVHRMHGIARFRGLTTQTRTSQMKDGTERLKPGSKTERTAEFLVLEFHDERFLYVPTDQIDLVHRYIGSGGHTPPLSRLGAQVWERQKAMVEQAVTDLASDLLAVQAKRLALEGFACPPADASVAEFEAAFPYQETRDQQAAIEATYADQESPRPMDRLICGDVGYGKTEVAIRACYRAAHAGKQAVVLVPTTVLADQHDQTFKERLAEFPVRVETISRLRSKKEQAQIVADAAAGKVDILIGTHRLLSKDIEVPRLGLVVIDEEQRFGVKHKERFKQMRTEVDVLTMTATPIPRTLNLSMLGLRDISTLATPPVDRQDVYTEVCTFDPGRIRLILMRELERKGQIYFVHNRVMDIEEWRDKLAALVPEARIVIGHGQMAEGELEQAMLTFTRHEADILLCTTIIESGIDNPRANTIVIDRADLFGLAELHQLRGRVGRSKLKAYAYFIVPESGPQNPSAAKRIHAIEEFSQLGAGFKIAMRDLEIRGAGNVLGAEQSGHIAAVGYELYCELLRRAAGRLQHKPQRDPKTIALDLGIETRIPDAYVRDARTRFELYRRFAHADTKQAVADLRVELEDRFGPIGPEVENCFLASAIRNHCRTLGVRSIVDAADHFILIADDLAALQRPFQAISEFVGMPGAYETAASSRDGRGIVVYLRTPGAKTGLARAKFACDLLAAAAARVG